MNFQLSAQTQQQQQPPSPKVADHRELPKSLQDSTLENPENTIMDSIRFQNLNRRTINNFQQKSARKRNYLLSVQLGILVITLILFTVRLANRKR